MIGHKVSYRRKAKGKTVRALARECDLSPSYISQLERGLLEPSIATLRRIAEKLEVPIYYFFIDDDIKYQVVRYTERKCIKSSDSKFVMSFYSPLASDSSFTPKMVSLESTIAPNTAVSSCPLIHEGDECLLITQGTLRVVVPDDTYILEKGDSIYIKENTPHEMINDTDEEVRAVSSLITPLSTLIDKL